MRSWQIVGDFGIDHLKLVDNPEPRLKPHQVRVKMRACSLNYRDLMVIKGIYNPSQKLPLVPLSDGAGEVIELGSDVQGLSIGDRVCATFSQKWCHGVASVETFQNTLGSPIDGTLSETQVFNQEGVVKFPAHLNFEEAATLPCAGVTAFNAIACQSGLKPGDTVLLEGTGGVSLFALQFAKLYGLESIIVSSSDEKLKRAQALSATHVINYAQHDDWQHKVLDLTNGRGVDAVIEVGGAKTLGRAIASVKKGGVVCLIGVLSGAKEAVDLRPILMNNIRIQGIFVGGKTVFEAMNRVISHGNIHPVIDRVFNFGDAPSAFSYLESQKHFGKVCISMS